MGTVKTLAYECKLTCTICQNAKITCPDTPIRQMDGHQKKMHECGQDCCLHTYLGDLQGEPHVDFAPGMSDHREIPEYDAKQNVNGKKPECNAGNDCCHPIAKKADAVKKRLDNDKSCDKPERLPQCEAECQQAVQECQIGEQQCQQKGKQAKQQYQQQKKGDENHDQELNDCFDRFQKTVEVEKDKQYDLTTPQVNDLLDKKNKIEYVHDDRTSGEHECEHLILEEGNQWKDENIESFDEGKKKILDDTSEDVLRKSPQDEFMTPKCIAKTMHEKGKKRLSERVFNAQCRADQEPDKNCPISADVVLKRQAEVNNARHKKNVEDARQKTEEMKKEEERGAKESKTNGNKSKEDKTTNADLDYLYYYDKLVSKKFDIKDKNPHRVARIRKNKEGKQPGIDRPPQDKLIQLIFDAAFKKIKQLPLGLRDMPLFLSNCPEKSVTPVNYALYGWSCTKKSDINPVQRAEAEKNVEAAKKKVFSSDHWSSESGKMNIVTDQPYTRQLLYTGASQNYPHLIASQDDVRFGESINIINSRNNMFTLDGWLNNGIIDHDAYYTISPGGKTLLTFAFPQGEFIEDGHTRFFWIGPGTTQYVGDFFDRYKTNTNIWHIQSQVYVQQPDFRGKKETQPALLELTFDKRRFEALQGVDITTTSSVWTTLLPKGFFDAGLISDIAGIFPFVIRGRALGDSDIVYNPGVNLLKTYAVRDEKEYVYSVRSYDSSTKVHTAANFIIEDSSSSPIITLSSREQRLIYQLRGK